MKEEKFAEIAKHLSEKFPGCQVEQKYDFDRGAQSFKVHVPGGTLLLKVVEEFIEDNSVVEILRLFNLWALAENLGKEKELGVLVSQRGMERFQRG